MEKTLLNISGWLLFLGGLFGMAVDMWKFGTARRPNTA